MSNTLRDHYVDQIEQMEHLITEEITYWPWENTFPMRELVLRYLGRSGKRLRPLLTFLFADLYEGQLERICWPAAAIEVYHTATLIYDDIQDNSEFRRGLPCAHITASTSTAMNLAAVIRTLMYHLLHRSPHMDPSQKLVVHSLLDQAATLVALGQSIDIGWHEGWYSSYRDYPYEQMIRWKSAALFGCAAATGTFLAGGNAEAVKHAENLGVELGRLFQKVDDYLDVFGNPNHMRRPLYNDFREGKITSPIICLLDQLSTQGRTKQLEQVLQSLAKRDAQQVDWQWLVDLMMNYNVTVLLQQQFQEVREQLITSTQQHGTNAAAQEKMSLFITSLLIPLTVQTHREC